jgi:hypothetical protein
MGHDQFKKGGQGGFLAGPCSQGKSWLRVAPLPFYEQLLKIHSSRTFRTKSILEMFSFQRSAFSDGHGPLELLLPTADR